MIAVNNKRPLKFQQLQFYRDTGNYISFFLKEKLFKFSKMLINRTITIIIVIVCIIIIKLLNCHEPELY